MNRLLLGVLGLLTLAACSTETEQEPTASAASPATVATLDLSAEPSTVEEAKRLCATPPTDWETTEQPAKTDYYGATWVLCHPYAPVVHAPPADANCVGNDIMEGCGMSTIDGRPYESWSFALRDDGSLGLYLPIDADNGYAHADGAPQHARGGHKQWLRLPVNPEDSGLLAPRLNGMREAIFVRLAREGAPAL